MEHEDPDREQRDSSFDRDPDAERKVEERFAEMAARAGAPDPIATDTVNRVVSGNYATPAAAFATASWMRKPRLATSAFRRAGGPGTLSKLLRFSEARRSFSTNVEKKFQDQPEAGSSFGMDLVKWVFMTSVGTFVGNLGDQAIRASGNYLLENMHNFSVYEPNKWPYDPPSLLAGVRKAPSLGDDEEPVDPVVEANLRAMYKAWYGQKESDFWAGYAQLVGSTSLPLDGQFVALSLMSHMLPPSEMYYWQSQDDALALLEACAQAVKDAGGKASAIYTCLSQHVDALKLPRSIAADLAQMVVSTLVHPPAPSNNTALLASAALSLGNPSDAVFAFLENVSFMIPEIGPLVSGTLSFLQIMFPFKHEDPLALVNAFVSAVDQLLDLHDIKEMRNDINHLTSMYLSLATKFEEYHRLNQKNMPPKDLKTPGSTVYDTFMKPLVEECVESGKLSGIIDNLINDERYKVDCLPLAMMAASLWIAYNGLYMQMVSYRDGEVSADAALPYSTVLGFIRKKMPALRANAELFKAARRKHVSDVKSEGGEKYDWRTGGLRVYVKWSVDDDAAPDAIPPGHGHYEEQDDGSLPIAKGMVEATRDQWFADIDGAVRALVDDQIKLWWAKFVFPNSPFFFSVPPSGPEVVQGTGQELTQGPVFDKWWACDTVTYAITFKTDTGESPRKESAPYKVEKGEVWVPDFPKDSPPPVPWPVPGHPEQNSRRAAAVLNALPDLNIPVDDTNPATVRLVYIKYGNSSDWEPVPAANTRLAKDIKATRVSTSWPTSALEIVPGSGHELRQGHDQLFHKWWNTDTVTYAVTFKTDRGESPRMETAPIQVEKVKMAVPSYPPGRHVPPFDPPGGPMLPVWLVENATPDLIVPVDHNNSGSLRMVYVKYSNGEWEPLPAAIAQLASDPKATRVSTQ